jgi:hypothetical protein
VNMIARSGSVDKKNFCDPLTGSIANKSQTLPPAYLANPRQMVVGKCFTDTVNIVAGDEAAATVLLSCRGSAAFLQIFSYRATSTCPKNGTSLFGIVFPTGRNCTARRTGVNPPYELGFGSNPCRTPATIGNGTRTEFASGMSFLFYTNQSSVQHVYSGMGQWCWNSGLSIQRHGGQSHQH